MGRNRKEIDLSTADKGPHSCPLSAVDGRRRVGGGTYPSLTEGAAEAKRGNRVVSVAGWFEASARHTLHVRGREGARLEFPAVAGLDVFIFIEAGANPLKFLLLIANFDVASP